MPRIKEIHLELENVETIKIPAKYILNFVASDNRKLIFGHKDYLSENEIYNEIAIIISNEIVGFEGHDSWMTEHEYNELNKYISSREDIVSISIIYEDETQKTLYANWSDYDEYDNEFQHNYINEDGDVLITIGLSEDKRIKMENQLNDKNYLSLIKLLN